ncbi:outer membrane usher protein [Serratia fonticola]
MVLSPARKLLRLQTHVIYLIFIMIEFPSSVYANANTSIQFNTDVLDVKDRENIDLSQFSRSGFIMPGNYTMAVSVNENHLEEQSIDFYPPDDDPSDSRACISPKLTMMLGLKSEAVKMLTWWHRGQCLATESLKGMEAHGDLASSSLHLSIPQAYLEYITTDWDPPSRWDEGIAGFIFDYNVNAQAQFKRSNSASNNNISGNGITGVNFGAWRLRADWQGEIAHHTTDGKNSVKNLDWTRYYVYRSIPALLSQLTIGEDYLDSAIFDSFRFTGVSLRSEDKMLPPNMRGYAPEVMGIAKTNAKVTISQQGRIIYETQVASGPFRIQDINEAVSGELDVRIEEQNGSVQEFKINTASIPYLTRPGQIRYKLTAGKPSDWRHNTVGSLFGTGELSWGVSNGWSLYGGGLTGDSYKSLSVGVGRDLMILGALSFDITQSHANFPNKDSSRKGDSYRLSYSKNFDDIDSQVTFAGYRFSENGFMTMSEYLNARYYDGGVGSSKEMYTVTFNKQFREIGLTSYLNYSHQTYWDRPVNDRYDLTLSSYFDIGKFKNLSVSLSGYHSRYNKINDDGIYLSFSVPWGNNANVSYNMASNRNNISHRVSYYNRLDDHNNYQLSTGRSKSGNNLSGYINHEGDMVELSANASYQEGSYSALGLTAQGGITLTAQGGALHRATVVGGTRLLLDTDGVPDVPVRGYGATTNSNSFGKAIVMDVNSYYRNRASIDIDKLADNAEATKSVVQVTLTDGAIGYRHFDVISGEKAMGIIKLADGSVPPFGAKVVNNRKQETGIVSDDGGVYLSGIQPGETMTVQWSGAIQCAITLPKMLPEDTFSNLFLPCVI